MQAVALFHDDHYFLDIPVHEVDLEVSAACYFPSVPLHQEHTLPGCPEERDMVRVGRVIGLCLPGSTVNIRTILKLLVRFH